LLWLGEYLKLITRVNRGLD